MELYTEISALISRILTRRYSTSFSSASRLFPREMQQHVYAIYGLVRIADEIVDTYRGTDSEQLLGDLEVECSAAVKRQYSPNPIVHSFAQTAHRYGIGPDLIKPFFASMRMDISPRTYDRQQYETYIYGSAEVVGLMCLKIFCDNDATKYRELAPGARKLGAAYQKVNFLRDMAADHRELGRYYFPDSSFEAFDAACKQAVTIEMRHDFEAALPYIDALSSSARPAVRMSYRYYEALLVKLEQTPVSVLKSVRIRLPARQKAMLVASHILLGRR